MKNPPWIVKVGGSLLSERRTEVPLIKEETIVDLAKDIKELKREGKRVILVHGAGSFGHPLAHQWEIHKGLASEPEKQKGQLKAIAQIQVQLYHLSRFLVEGLESLGILSFPLQTSALVALDEGRIHSFLWSEIEDFLSLGFIPLLSGVPCYDRKQGIAILSGDQIATYLALFFQSPMVVHFTEVGAVYDGDPRKNPLAKRITSIGQENWQEVRTKLSGSEDIDVTGGMLGKVTEAFQLAKKGIPVLISPLGRLQEALLGKEGTLIQVKKNSNNIYP